MLKSSDGAVLLYDMDDVNSCSDIRGNLTRKESLDMLSKQYCFEVLIVLLDKLSQMLDYKKCNSFMTVVKEH